MQIKTRLSNFFVIIILLFSSFQLFSQKEYIANPYIDFKVNTSDGYYITDYTFKDQFENLQHFTISYPVELTNQMLDRFGVPVWMFDKYLDTEENRIQRQKIIKQGLFKLTDNTIEVDKSAVIDYYSEYFCKPIAGLIVDALAQYGKDTRCNRIEMAMRFVQDIPYGTPDISDKELHYGGVSPPPKVLIDMYGDCDSKALLFAGIMIYLIDSEDIIFLNQTKHVLTAIKGEPEKGHTYVRHKGKKYLIAETAGPGKRLLGEKGKYYSSIFKIEPLNISLVDIIPYGDNSNAHFSKQYPSVKVDPNSILIKNVSKRSLRFQLSTDNKNWKSFNLNPNYYGEYAFDRNRLIFLRIRGKNMKYQVYKIETGKSYRLNWNSKKHRWETEY